MVIVKWFNLYEYDDVIEGEKLFTIIARGFDDYWDALESSTDYEYLISNWYSDGMMCDEDKELHIFVSNDVNEFETLEFFVDALNYYAMTRICHVPHFFKASYLHYLDLKQENFEREFRENWDTYKQFIFHDLSA